MAELAKRQPTIVPSSISPYMPLTESKGFHAIRHGKSTSELAKIKTSIDSPAQLNMYGDATIINKDFTLFISKYNELANGVRPTAKQLLDALLITNTESGRQDTLVKLPLDEYMAMRNLKDIKSARSQVKEDLKAIDKLGIEYKDKRRGKQGDFLNVKISGGTSGIVRGIIVFRFNQDFFNMLMNYNIMPYPKEILRLNSKYNPNSQHFLRKISEHKNMNYFKANEGNIISVKTLIEASTELPRYEDIKEEGRIEQRIIEPFERDMDAIESFSWYYCGKKGAIVERPNNYNEFINLNVMIEWKEYPTRRERKKTSKKKEVQKERS